MSRRSLWLLAAVLFLVAAVAAFVGSQAVMGVAFVVVAAAMAALAVYERPRAPRR
ncbi:hypothetical protein ACVU7I_14380 [Patulibacter sp. S7RM1-6]